MALTWDQVVELGQRGYSQDEIRWIHALPNDQAVWEAVAVIEPRAEFRRWKGTVDFQKFRDRGYTEDEVQWLMAADNGEMFNTSWATIEGRNVQRQQAAQQATNPALAGPQFPVIPGPTSPGAVNFPAIPGAGAANNKGAESFIKGTLEMYGLGGLGSWAWKEFLNGSPIEAILIDMRKRPEYKARFPAMEALAKKGRALSEQQYIDFEKGVSQVFHAAGLPQGFYDKPDDFTKFLTNDVSLPELQDRVTMYAQAAFQVAPEVKDELKRLYGVSEGGLTAYFIDDKRALPLIQKQWAATQIAAQGDITGWGQLNQGEAERLAELGVTSEQARSGFTQLGLSKELFNPLEGGEATTTREEQMAAAFEGNIDAQAEIGKQTRRRLSQFEGGGSFAGSPAEGYTGIGSAR